MKALLFFATLLIAGSVHATISGMEKLELNFTNPPLVLTNARWSDTISVSTNGLGWDGATNSLKDFWIETVPVAIGTSWRPSTVAGITIETDPAKAGNLFARYSVDKLHWSTWQWLDQPRDTIQVPQITHSDYWQLFLHYRENAVPWKDDEEAAVKWIIKQNPDYFEKHQPFIGYVQFRMEGSLPGNHRIQRLKISVGWQISGLMAVPPGWDRTQEQGRYGPWRFEAK